MAALHEQRLRDTKGRNRAMDSDDIRSANPVAPGTAEWSVSARHYLLPCAVALLALGIRWRLEGWLGDGVPTVALLGVVAFAVWYGGTGPAIVTAVLGYAVAAASFAPRTGLLPALDPALVANTVVYGLSAALVISVGQHLRRLTRQVDRADQSLRAGEEAWQSLLGQSMIGIVGMDLQGRLEFANARFCEMVGRAWPDLQGLRIQDITYPDDLPHNAELFEQLSAEGTPFTLEKRYLRPDGVENWVAKRVFAVSGADGRPRAALAVVLDVTDRKKAEQERARLLESERHARTVAEQANRIKDEFLAVLSRELRAPLSNVISWGRLLQTKYSHAEPDLVRGLTVIVSNAKVQDWAARRRTLRRAPALNAWLRRSVWPSRRAGRSEVSRFARNSREWEPSVEMCRVVDPVLIEGALSASCAQGPAARIRQSDPGSEIPCAAVASAKPTHFCAPGPSAA